MQKEVTAAKVLMGRLPKGEDLLGALTQVCADGGVTLAKVEAIGAVEQARLAFYDQIRQSYNAFELPMPLELVSLVGNVSLKDGQPILHAHVVLADPEGRAYGGHLLEGAPVFACEYAVTVLEGGAFHRGFDEPTGLPLWVK